MSLSDMERYAELQRSTVIEALRVLTTPMFGNRVIDGQTYPPIPLILQGPVPPRTPTWYAPDRRAWTWYWRSDFLNAREQVTTEQHRLWPHLTRRQRQGNKRRMSRRRQVR